MRPATSKLVHASCVAREGAAVLLTGPSGSGKSDLALRLIDRGWTLVADDRTLLHRRGDTLFASPPATIAGRIEVRGLGILELGHVSDVEAVMAVNLADPAERFPFEDMRASWLGVQLREIRVDARAPSAPIHVELALRMDGDS